ncbi:MAG: T9SS type A sorting domain-containing protein [Bacteroidota bacterium]
MKKFTFLMLLVLTVSTVFAQLNSQLIEKTEQTQNVLKPIIDASNLLLKHSEAKNYLTGNNELFLKNAAATQKIDSTVMRGRVAGETEWEYLWKEEFHWDASHQSTWIEKEWDENSGNLYVSAETVTEYDNEGRVEVLYNSYRNEPGEDLFLEGKMVPEYDSERLESVQYFASEDDGENWLLELEVFYTYNNSGKLIEIEYWNLEDSDLLLSMRNTMSYNESGQQTQSQTFYMMEGEEVLFSETDFEYNNSGQLVNEIDWSLNLTTLQLEKSSRTATEYNALGDILAETYFNWDESSETWLEDDKDEYTYNTIDFSDVLFPYSVFMYEFIGVEMPNFTGKAVAEINGYTWVDNDWVQVENQIFYYSSIDASNVELTENNDFTVYPNPATDYITFSWAGNQQHLLLEVFKVDGVKMLEQQVSSGQNIQLENLESGVYLYKMKNENETLFSGKLVKQ